MNQGITNISLDLYQTLAVAVGALFLGRLLRKKIRFFERFCIPAPVIGGGVVAVLVLLLSLLGILEVSFDETLKDICMVIFFTTVGYLVNVSILKSGGKALLRLLVVITLIAFLQNGIALALTKVLNVPPLLSLCVGSVSQLGGHGTSAAFGPVLEENGLAGASTLCAAAATFGLIGGGLIGGPIGNALIRKKDLVKTAAAGADLPEEKKEKPKDTVYRLAPAACHLALAIGIGSAVSWLISLTGLVFPKYLGGLITGAVISNLGTLSGKYPVYDREVRDIGAAMLDFFLGIALVTLKLRMLAGLAVPMLVILCVQVAFMAVFAWFAAFRILGGDYDAAVLTAGVCGFGLGATPNAMANVQSVTSGRPRSKTAYLLIPVAGGLFLDLINSFTIVLFINLLK